MCGAQSVPRWWPCQHPFPAFPFLTRPPGISQPLCSDIFNFLFQDQSLALVSLSYSIHPIFLDKDIYLKMAHTQFWTVRLKETFSMGFKNEDLLLLCVNSPKWSPLPLRDVNERAQSLLVVAVQGSRCSENQRERKQATQSLETILSYGTKPLL